MQICFIIQGEDIPSFPVQESILSAVKERVNLARELDKLQLQVRKTNTQVSWIEKAANEMDLVFEERQVCEEYFLKFNIRMQNCYVTVYINNIF